jgi:hypothetical protein
MRIHELVKYLTSLSVSHVHVRGKETTSVDLHLTCAYVCSGSIGHTFNCCANCILDKAILRVEWHLHSIYMTQYLPT